MGLLMFAQNDFFFYFGPDLGAILGNLLFFSRVLKQILVGFAQCK